MSELIVKHIVKNYLSTKGSVDNKGNDLFYERVPVIDRHGRNTGKMKKQKRGPPPGLTEPERKSLRRVMDRAESLDNAISICGIRVGWGAIVGVIPFIGDFFDTLMALWVYRECQRCKISKTVESRMMFNIMIDFFIGLVPFLGDVGDAMFRANTMNAALLYEHLAKRGQERISGGQNPGDKARSRSRTGRLLGGRGRTEDARAQDTITQQPAMTETMVPPRSASHSPGEITRPQKAATKSGGWLSRFTSSANPRPVDPEKAEGDRQYQAGAETSRGRTRS